jgi:hypothetical protein
MLIIQNEMSGELSVAGVYRIHSSVELLMRQLDSVFATYKDVIVGWVPL